MNVILKGLVSSFSKSFGIPQSKDTTTFEKFVNFTVVSNEYSKTFHPDLVGKGSGGDTGMDGIGIIVNGHLVENKDEIDDLLAKNGALSVSYIMIQSKTSSKFESPKMLMFFDGVKDFFSEEPSLPANDFIKEMREMSGYILSKAEFLSENPTLKLFYVTTGKWIDDAHLVSVVGRNKKDLENLDLFSRVNITPVDQNGIISLHRKVKEVSSCSFSFSSRITLPDIEGILESYIGVLPFSEFMKIICDEEGGLKNVFEDNVRDFQGDSNDVNIGIGATLTGSNPDIFTVLNNGVTIVASSVSVTGNTFTIKGYQIVNGCQTSNVLYNNRGTEGIETVNVPIKIIAAEDDKVKNQITLATNSQTAIKKEQLTSLTEFQRNLEAYYASCAKPQQLYYERRSKQYNSDNSVPGTRIITIAIQIKCFVSVFLEQPHLATSFFGSIVKKISSNDMSVFTADHKHEPYYASAYAFYKLESFFRGGVERREYKKVRFHMLMMFRVLVCGKLEAGLNSKKIVKISDKIVSTLNNDHETKMLFQKCIDIINVAKENGDFDHLNKQDSKSVSKTRLLLERAMERYNETPTLTDD